MPQPDEHPAEQMSEPECTRSSSPPLPALDGLRGIAVLIVLVFHVLIRLPAREPGSAALAAGFQFGWLGVDIFFVLSGFLITRILLAARETPDRFKNFYARRFLRIIPPYYLLLTVVFVVLPLFVEFDTEGVKRIQRNQAWFWTHLTNLGFVWHRQVWASADWLVMDHLWSLAVEEQFYLVWPFAVFFLPGPRLKHLCYACLVFSPVLRCVLWLMDMRNGALYLPTPCRLDGLAMGALVAVLALEPGGLVRVQMRFARLGIVATLLLAGLTGWRSGLRLTDSPTVVFAPALINVIAAAIIVQVVTAAGRFWPGLLSLSCLRSFGRYSYALYLFHALLLYPLRKFMPPRLLIEATGSELAANLAFLAVFLAVSFALAWLSWHAFEQHWLKLKRHFVVRPPPVQA